MNNEKIKLRQAVIVEGKYDKIKLSSILEALIIETNGFQIYKDKEKLSLIRSLAKTRGIIIMTDSDAAGFQIRKFLGGSIPKEQIIHVFMPDIPGKEKRKAEFSAERKLGIEGIPIDIIKQKLELACVHFENAGETGGTVTLNDLYDDGLSGREHSACLRKAVLKALGLPERLSTSAMLKIINLTVGMEGYKSAVESAKKSDNSDDPNA